MSDARYDSECEIALRISRAGTQKGLECRSQGRPVDIADRRDEVAFYLACTRLLWGYAGKHVPPDRHEDFVQRAWLRVLRDLPGFVYDPERGPICSRILSLAHRERADWLRHNAPKPDRPMIAVGPSDVAAIVDPHADEYPLHAAIRHEEQERGARLLAVVSGRLSEPAMQVFHLHVNQERSFRQVADELELTLRQVRSLYDSAAEELRSIAVSQAGRRPDTGQKKS